MSPPGERRRAAGLAALLAVFSPGSALAQPAGYLVWTKGAAGDRSSRRLVRMTLPEKSDLQALTSGEDVEAQISPDGVWVAYAKAKLPASDYLQLKLWKLYLVSVHGVGEGREEILIDDNGYWPSWGGPGRLRYSQVHPEDDRHTRILEVVIDDYGQVLEKRALIDTRSAFPGIPEINECHVSPDGRWFAARTRGSPSVSGVGAYWLAPPEFKLLARAGSVGCMPRVAPSGLWGLIAGREHGIRWGDAPDVPDRKEDQLLIPSRGPGDLAYHPGISTDEQWALAAHSTDNDHNAGPYDLYLYQLEGRAAGPGQLMASGGFNGWPHLWVGQPGPPPAPRPHVDRFQPDRYTLVTGESARLQWQTSFADRVTLDGVAVATDGEQTVAPAATTVYNLDAASTSLAAADRGSVEITVNPEPRPVVVEEFAADPPTTRTAETVVLRWRVRNAATLELAGRWVAPSGELKVSPVETTTYGLTAQGFQGPVTASLTVTVEPLNPLLPDRGGCLCSGISGAGAAVTLALLLALPGAWRRRTGLRGAR
ncbi:MAG: hypothetical protein HYZ28_00515 [Myxococcales bacterium]|nr:hypothetical protein [Myxococcales bacterium]